MPMTKRRFGWTDVEVPIIGQGTWMIEGSQAQEQRAVAALQLGIDLGLTHVDTAEMYGNGRAEELTAEAIGARRNEVFLVSKVLPYNASYDGTLRACERSLNRLQTDTLDLYLLHWSGRHPIRETMRAMETLVQRGCVRFIGVSNLDLEELKEAQRALRHERLACNQVLYHLGDRGIEYRLLPYCAEQQIAVVAYSPFGHSAFPSPNSRSGRVLEAVARKNGATARQVVLHFLTRHSGVFTIPKASREEHVRENSRSLDWELSAEDLNAIDQAFPAPDYEVPLGML